MENQIFLVIKKKKFIKKTEEQLNQEYNENINFESKSFNTTFKKKFNYWTFNPLISPAMRMILIDWLMEISSQLNFKRSTFHLTVTIIDVYLSNNQNCHKDLFQLLGVTALFISAKYEVNI